VVRQRSPLFQVIDVFTPAPLEGGDDRMKKIEG